MMHAFCLFAILLFAFFPSPQDNAAPHFESTPCPVLFSAHVDCGELTVPENRDQPSSRTIRIAVAIYRASANSLSPDPLLFLDGGPGSRTLDAWSRGVDSLIQTAARTHDVIVFDQRGMGYSDPALTCPEQVSKDTTDWLKRCHDRLVSSGVDLAAYTTRENAADAADLMRALGYTSYNVWGGSYGSSLALTLLRDHPEGIRSVVLTALQPIQVGLQSLIPPMFQRTLNQISDQCAANARCSAAFPGSIRQKLAEIVTRLDEAPVELDVDEQTISLNGSIIVTGLQGLFKDQTGLSNAPALIEALYQKQYQVVIPYAQALKAQSESAADSPIGAFWSIRCTDSTLATTPEQLEASLAQIDPEFRDAFRVAYQSDQTTCRMWGAHAPGSDELSPALSNVPVLILNGEFDPYSSPNSVEITLAGLPNGHAVWFPGYGHGVNGNPCAQQIFASFIDDPATSPNDSCAQRLPPLAFRIPRS